MIFRFKNFFINIYRKSSMSLSDGVNTANTLSIAFQPGQDLRFPSTASQSIFTFGDYRIERSNEPDVITGTSANLSFTPFSTLENMGMSDFNPPTFLSVQNNELRPNNSDPYSYSYFGSFYTEVARSINNIIDTFPYAMLSFDGLSGTSFYDYSESFNNITKKSTSSFKIPASAVTNEGYVLFSSGSPVGNQVSLMTQTNLFEIQLSASTTAQTESYKINSYSFFTGTSAYLQFEIEGHLSNGSPIPITGTSSVAPVYIRPSRKRVTEYKMRQSRLETQLLGEGLFDIPDVDNEKRDFRYRVPWPRTIDGFNPDTRGYAFEQYKDSMLMLAGNTDIDKTDIMIKTMIPDNFIQFDTKTQIYQKLTASYAKQFDEIKQFVDNIAYAHSLNYNDKDSVPEKFLIKLSNLLGWKLSSNFSEIDLFEYLANDENPEQNSFAYYNVEIWKRILININWLYKRKGTRDALQFMFKLMGAPDCLVVFDEFVYEINSTVIGTLNEEGVDQIPTPKINSRGFINFDDSQFIFQEGGAGRGTGEKYINQWSPEFSPIKRVDNKKVQVGLTAFTGSENIVNTKEVCATLSPANAIECDVFEWYQLSGSCWVWGTSGSPYFSGNTVPFEYAIDNCDFVSPETITGMTFNQYIDFIYSSNIEPRNRKTNNQSHTTFGYPELKKIYMNYYLMSYPQSNRLTIKKLEAFLELMEVNFQSYLMQLIPATTILECQGTTYRNTIFQRQRFVYKQGINDGSEFQNALPPDLRPILNTVEITSRVNDFLADSIDYVVINSKVSQGINESLTAIQITGYINQNNFVTSIAAVDNSSEVQPGISKTTIVQ